MNIKETLEELAELRARIEKVETKIDAAVEEERARVVRFIESLRMPGLYRQTAGALARRIAQGEHRIDYEH